MTECSYDKLSETLSEKGDSKGAQTVDVSEPYVQDNSLNENSKGNEGIAYNEEIVEIKEKMFIEQTNDIYLNPEDYLGKTIKYEGIFKPYYDEELDETYYFVIRYGPGCCGYDSNAGFEVVWFGDYPNDNDWVEVIGVLEEYEENGNEYLRLQLSSLKVMDTRGAEYVD
jgi:uncharacterized membrane protein YcgQ (UPF0703/DUF1980 family)